MERKQFTFYRSYYEAVKVLPKKEQTAVLLAICGYALDGIEPNLTGTAKGIFELTRPTLDAARRKAEGGAKKRSAEDGAKIPQSKTEDGDNKKKKENKNENELEKERENECYPPNPLAAVMTAYLDKVNPMASQTCLGELKGFVEEMGAECCLRAIDIALDSKKTSWSYIRAILRDKLAAGVKCLADWDELDAKREQEKTATGEKKHPAVEKMMGGRCSTGDFEREAIRKLMEGSP